MNNNAFVDAVLLENALSLTASAIRTKTQGSSSILFNSSNGFANEIEKIKAGVIEGIILNGAFPGAELYEAYSGPYIYTMARMSGTESPSYADYSEFYDIFSTTLIEANLSDCVNIYYRAFKSCHNLVSISFPKCENISDYAFHECYNLTNADFPSCKKIDGTKAFADCSNLLSVSFPVCLTVGYSSAFANCVNLTDVYFPLAKTIGFYTFWGCSNLTTISLASCSVISSYAFAQCTHLMSVYLLGSSSIRLNSSVFNSTPIVDSTYTGAFGSIYFPNSMLASYKTSTNWTIYSDRMVGV